MFRSRLALLAVSLLALVGCGGKKGTPVKGTVKFPPSVKLQAGDGQGVGGDTITIMLEPEDASNKELASGPVSASDGSVSLAKVPPGKYKVGVRIDAYAGGPEGVARHKALELFNYNFDRAKSGLTVDIEAGGEQTILVEFDEAERSAGSLHNTPSGELRVVAPTNFGLAEIGTAVADFISAYPRLRINLTMSDRLTDPIEGGYDIAISVDMPRGASSNLVARKLNTSRRILCAAPDYLRERAAPHSPDDLVNHQCLSYSYVASPDEWHLAGADGEHATF